MPPTIPHEWVVPIATGVTSAMVTLIGTIVGLTRFIGNKYAADIAQIQQSQVAYQTKTDAKIVTLEDAERKCMQDKFEMIGKIACLEALINGKTR